MYGYLMLVQVKLLFQRVLLFLSGAVQRSGPVDSPTRDGTLTLRLRPWLSKRLLLHY